MKNFLVAALLAVFSFTACGSNQFPSPDRIQDVGEYLLMEKSSQVMKLTKPSEKRAGGTGFALKLPSGKVVTITNSHVCELAEGGVMAAQAQGTERWVNLRIIEKAVHTDLCILEGLHSYRGLELAESRRPTEHMWVLGYPLLRPLSVADGYEIRRGVIEMIVGESGEIDCTGPGRRVETYKLPPFDFEVALCIWALEGIDTSIEIRPGNSGSPVFNSDGDVVGVAFASMGDTNFGSIISLETLRDFVSVY